MRPIELILLIGLVLGFCGFGLDPQGLDSATQGTAQTLDHPPTQVRGLAWND